MLMAHLRRVKAHRAERQLHDRTGAEGEDLRPDAHRAAQQSANERDQTEQRDADGADRQPLQSQPRAAAI